jgi:hypothetical protein
MIPFITTVSAQGIQEWKDVSQGGCVVDGVPTFKCLEVVFSNLVYAASGLVMVALFVMFVFGSYSYLTSFGNPEKVKRAQGTFKFAIIGLILFVSAFLILKVIDILFLGNTGKLFQLNLENPTP